MFNLGVIVPQSNFLPKLSRDLPIACKMGLSGSEDRINLFFESGGFNENTDVLKDKIQSLVMRENLHAVLCPLNSGLIDAVNEVCKAEEVALIINTMGEDVTFEYAVSPSVFVNSYQLWHNAWLTGYYAANAGHKDLVSLYARHDGGYGATLALAVGAEAGDGNLKMTQITHMDSVDEDCTERLRELDEMKPDAILAHHSGKEAVNFLRDIESSKLETPLITLPTFVEDIVLQSLTERAEGLRTVGLFKNDNEAYQRFAHDFQEQSGRVAHPHIVMAAESVALFANAVKNLNDTTFSSLIKALENSTYSGPRGTVSFNMDAQKSPSTCYIKEIIKTDSGTFSNQTIDQFEVPDLCHEHYVLAQKNTQKQGWVNPYLIA